MAGWQNDLFHNHTGPKSYHYRYPLIQYRVRKGRAALFAMNEGVEAVQEMLSSQSWEIRWQGEPHNLMVEDLKLWEHTPKMLHYPKSYKLLKWLPLNQENHRKWQKCHRLTDKIALLENILVAQILTFCRSVDWRLEERLELYIEDIQLRETVRCHDIPMMALNVTYAANISLPAAYWVGAEYQSWVWVAGAGWASAGGLSDSGCSRFAGKFT